MLSNIPIFRSLEKQTVLLSCHIVCQVRHNNWYEWSLGFLVTLLYPSINELTNNYTYVAKDQQLLLVYDRKIVHMHSNITISSYMS